MLPLLRLIERVENREECAHSSLPSLHCELISVVSAVCCFLSLSFCFGQELKIEKGLSPYCLLSFEDHPESQALPLWSCTIERPQLQKGSGFFLLRAHLRWQLTKIWLLYYNYYCYCCLSLDTINTSLPPRPCLFSLEIELKTAMSWNQQISVNLTRGHKPPTTHHPPSPPPTGWATQQPFRPQISHPTLAVNAVVIIFHNFPLFKHLSLGMRNFSYPPRILGQQSAFMSASHGKWKDWRGGLFPRGTDAFPMFALQFWLSKRVTVDKYYRWGRKLPPKLHKFTQKTQWVVKGGATGALLTKLLKGRLRRRLVIKKN